MMSIEQLIMHAYNTVPYYMDLFNKNSINPLNIKCPEDLVKIPPLKKQTIQKNALSLVSNQYRYDQLIRERTSGSTGEPLTIYKSKKDIIYSNFSMAKFRYKYYNIRSDMKTCNFYMFSRLSNGNLSTKPSVQDSMHLSLNVFCTDYNTLKNYVKCINDFNPSYILSLPSSLFMFAKFIEDNSLSITADINCIELKGEYVSPLQIEKIKEVFQAKILNHYGCTETYGIAFSCPQGNMHVLNDNVVVEIVNDNYDTVSEGEKGKICVTSLNNKAMPLIRYMLDDEALLVQEKSRCPCGHKGSIIKILSGRVTEYIQLENNRQLNSGIIYLIIEEINFIYSNAILQFQVIQNDINEFLVSFVLSSDCIVSQDQIESLFITKINMYGLKDAKCFFSYPSSIIPNETTGKLKYFENHIKNNFK